MQLFVHWIVPSISHAHIYAVLLKDHLYVFKQPKAKRGQRDKKKNETLEYNKIIA